MKNHLSVFFSTFCVILLLPLFVTLIMSGSQVCVLAKTLDEEDFLPVLVSGEIPQDYEEETIKAQMVIARTNLQVRLSGGETLIEILQPKAEQLHSAKNFLQEKKFYKKYQQAAQDTRGMVLSWEGQLRQAPYHRASGGSTRSGKEVFRDSSYDYLEAVASPQDIEAKEYLQGEFFTQSQLKGILKRTYPDMVFPTGDLAKDIRELSRDSAGYVLEVKAGNVILSGEELRKCLGLPSSCYTLQTVGGELRFMCKGEGHGLGFSQFGGNVLAQQGSTFEEILSVYFPNAQVTNL